MISEMPLHDLTGTVPMSVGVDLRCLPAMNAICSASILCPAMQVLSKLLAFWTNCLVSSKPCPFSSMPLLRCSLMCLNSDFGICPVHSLSWDYAVLTLLWSLVALPLLLAAAVAGMIHPCFCFLDG